MKQFKTIKEATQFVGGLSKPSKMPCYSYGLPISHCITGSKLVNIKGSSCEFCYAGRGFYQAYAYTIKPAQQRRLESISKPDWVAAMSFLVNRKEMTYFRWHDAGDLQSFQHLLSIVQIAENCPGTVFWIPTREKKFVNQFLNTFGKFPKNLIVRVSATMRDEKAGDYKNTSTIHEHKKPIGFACKAAENNNECGDCRACWDPKIKNISYKFH